MAISANTLFHFTSIDNLLKIIKSKGIFAQYSEEHFEDILPDTSIYKVSLIPMASFCDLTLSQLATNKDHTIRFGKYGIGLSKDWGIQNKISPVIYIHKNSLILKDITSFIKTFKALKKKKLENENWIKDLKIQTVNKFKYVKAFKSKWHKKRKSRINYNHYNEREWRFCPDGRNFNVFSDKPYNQEKIITKNETLRSNPLVIEPYYIKYIIIQNAEEIDIISNALKISYGNKLLNELTSKIITWKEIEEDFI